MLEAGAVMLRRKEGRVGCSVVAVIGVGFGFSELGVFVVFGLIV